MSGSTYDIAGLTVTRELSLQSVLCCADIQYGRHGCLHHLWVLYVTNWLLSADAYKLTYYSSHISVNTPCEGACEAHVICEPALVIWPSLLQGLCSLCIISYQVVTRAFYLCSYKFSSSQDPDVDACIGRHAIPSLASSPTLTASVVDRRWHDGQP